MTRVECGWCHRRMWSRRWVRHQRLKHHGFAPFVLRPTRKEEAVPTAGWNDLPAGAMIVGMAKCSEAEPQCTAVAYLPNGDLILANHLGARLHIPAAEVAQVLELAGRQR